MRLKITHMKAPWPKGAGVGDVVDFPAVPAWAVGKCDRVGDDVAVTIAQDVEPENGIDTFDGDGSGESLPEIQDDTDAGDETTPPTPRRGRPPKARE